MKEDRDHINLVPLADRVGMTPTEWLALCDHRGIRPFSPEEWRDAVLGTVNEAAG